MIKVEVKNSWAKEKNSIFKNICSFAQKNLHLHKVQQEKRYLCNLSDTFCFTAKEERTLLRLFIVMLIFGIFIFQNWVFVDVFGNDILRHLERRGGFEKIPRKKGSRGRTSRDFRSVRFTSWAAPRCWMSTVEPVVPASTFSILLAVKGIITSRT